MKFLDRIARQASLCASDVASLVKVALLSRWAARPLRLPGDGEIVILGNGPSLRETIDKHFDWLSRHTLMAVNFAANAPDFARLKPQRYILADPHFFDAAESDGNVGRLWKNLREARHAMTLHVPAPRLKQARALVSGSSLSLEAFNLTPLEGHGWLTHALFDMRLGMPRPRDCGDNGGDRVRVPPHLPRRSRPQLEPHPLCGRRQPCGQHTAALLF